MRWGRTTWAVVAIAALLAGCTSAPPERAGAPTPSTSTSPVPSAPASRHVVFRGVAIDVPARWPRNKVECSRPLADTVVVEPAGGFFCLDHGIDPRDLGQVSYAWMGSYLEHLQRRTILGGATLTSHFLTTLHGSTVAGERVRLHGSRLPDGRHLQFVQFPRRRTFLTVVSQDRALVRSIVGSVGFVRRDPRSGCLVHTHRFDDGLGRRDAPHHRMVAGHPTSALACRYLDGWLENAHTLSRTATARLVRALNAAPPTSDEHRPREWPGCIYVSNTFHIPKLPIAVRFRYDDGRTALVVARPVYCTRLQSYITNGTRTRRLGRPVANAFPRTWNVLSADV